MSAPSAIAIASVCDMAHTTATRGRRAWGSLDPENVTNLYARGISKEAKAFYDQVANATGVPLPVLLEEIAKRIELDPDGRPAWWPAQQEGLDLKTA